MPVLSPVRYGSRKPWARQTPARCSEYVLMPRLLPVLLQPRVAGSSQCLLVNALRSHMLQMQCAHLLQIQCVLLTMPLLCQRPLCLKVTSQPGKLCLERRTLLFQGKLGSCPLGCVPVMPPTSNCCCKLGTHHSPTCSLQRALMPRLPLMMLHPRAPASCQPHPSKAMCSHMLQVFNVLGTLSSQLVLELRICDQTRSLQLTLQLLPLLLQLCLQFRHCPFV
mmetsp:Transcript_50185/g.83161  ORF Transcript_50185/g.83161 Transcript_50185/m.83161 type:complete len:222 (-) Transcript_50185:1080-1745(-)